MGTQKKWQMPSKKIFIKQFQIHTSLIKENVMKLLQQKLTIGGSDRASKIIKYANILGQKMNNYHHFPCDSHITETSWEEVQDMAKVTMVEDAVKDANALFINSASRKLKLAQICGELDEKTLALKSLFKIKYLTSETSATHTTLTDYIQILKLTLSLKDDRSIKRKRRKTIANTCA